MSVIRKDLGIATAYGYAVSKGYTGTEEEFSELMASYATVAEEAQEAAEQATQAVQTAQAAVNTATTKAGEAATSASGAATSASQAGQSATAAAGLASTASAKAAEAGTSATNAAASETVATQAAQTATTKAGEASASATAASQSATAAAGSASDASDDADRAETAAESVSAAAEQIATNTADIGALKTYSSSTAECKRYFPIVANIPVVFRPISAANTSTKMNIYGINNDDTNSLLIGQVALNNTVIVTPTAAYKGIRVITSPYNDVPFSFGFVQNVNGLEYRVDMLQEIADTAKSNTDAVSNILFSGHHKLNVSGKIVADYTSVSQGEVYRFYAWNVAGMLANNPVVYVVDNNNTSTNMSSAKITYENGFYWEITIPANTKSLRFYANKASNVDYAECDYAVVKVQGTMIDFIHDRLDTKTDKMSMFNRTTCKIFKRVVCCGDSYTAGYTNVGGVVDSVNEEFAWPHYMATLTGNDYVNCGASGTTVLTWLNHERGLSKAQAAGYAQAYIIGLMINDVGTSEAVGTTDDIGTDAQTYYGGMSKIIRELNAISNTAKIFVLTCPRTVSAYVPYNQAVHDIVEAYAQTYPVHLIDLYSMRDLFSNASITADAIGGHYTAVGYEQFAEIIAYAISDYINNHVSDFQNIHKIPYII